jgi:hypothetical protein
LAVACCCSLHPAGALLLDPFRTVVPAAAYPQPSAAEVANMTLLDAHCGSFQKVCSVHALVPQPRVHPSGAAPCV